MWLEGLPAVANMEELGDYYQKSSEGNWYFFIPLSLRGTKKKPNFDASESRGKISKQLGSR